MLYNEKICIICGVTFRPRTGNKKVCSRECSRKRTELENQKIKERNSTIRKREIEPIKGKVLQALQEVVDKDPAFLSEFGRLTERDLCSIKTILRQRNLDTRI